MLVLMGCCRRGQRRNLVDFAGEKMADGSKLKMDSVAF